MEFILGLLLGFFFGFVSSGILYAIALRRPIAKAFKSIHEDIARITDTLFPVDSFTCAKCETLTKETDYDEQDRQTIYAQLKESGICEVCTRLDESTETDERGK